MKTVTIPAFKRPEALEILLKSLKANDLNGWKILIRLEPSTQTQNCIKVINKILLGNDFLIHVNSKVRGVRKNTFDVVSSAFEMGSSLNVYLEEDLIVSPDALSMAAWYQGQCIENLLCLNFLARISGSSACFSTPRYPNSLVKTRSFNSLGVVFTKQQWEDYFRDNWLIRPNGTLTYAGYEADGWDFSMYSFLLNNPNLSVLQPLFARANHVGGEGTYCTDDYQNKSFSYVQINTENHTFYEVVSEEEISGSDKGFFVLMNEMNTCINTLKKVEGERRHMLSANILEIVNRKIKNRIKQLEASAEIQAFKGKIKRNMVLARCLNFARRIIKK